MSISVKNLLHFGKDNLKAIEEFVLKDNKKPIFNIYMNKNEVLEELNNSGAIYTHPFIQEWIESTIFRGGDKLEPHTLLFLETSLTNIRDVHKLKLLGDFMKKNRN
jgi:hypothetical protein